jgi:hypothetical protein
MENKFIVGLSDKTPALPTKQGFLLIDDGPIAEVFLKKKKDAVLFAPIVHSIDLFR